MRTVTESSDSKQNSPSITKVLVANRGAIATRIIRTLKTRGIGSVAVFSSEDSHSLHVEQADEAYCLGQGSATDTYLQQQKLIDLALSCGAQAIHPGYGFLSENPEFVNACEAAGICFIGPTAEQMKQFGLKHSARELAMEASVPLLPGTGILETVQEAVDSADAIGYPLILKSTAGGGGIGMQVVHSPDELHKAFESVKRLSANNFANDGVFLEKYITRARHIEVQVIGDGLGQVYALGERDCSSQRRHQKVIEETPAPNLSDSTRVQMQQTAVRLMESVAYRNAGTVEFIYDPDSEEFYFLEVNTRLQVEHGVTEMVWGVDLVGAMIDVASGETEQLASSLSDLKPQGHAIQVRLYAEDPNRNFQPSAGLLTQVQFPDAIAEIFPDKEVQQDPGHARQLRIDTWVEAGLEVSSYYDPMLAKMIVWSASRDEAIDDLVEALRQSALYGIETNLTYLQAVLVDEAFRSGSVHTRYLNTFTCQPATIDVLKGGTMTTIQDYPARTGYWHVGVPPSGPFDSDSFRTGNLLLGNDPQAAGLEITLDGPHLRFNNDCAFVITGAEIKASLDSQPIQSWSVQQARAGQILSLGKISGGGSRSYLLFAGGLDCPEYLGSRSTFTLGQFGGHGGRALRSGDVLHLADTDTSGSNTPGTDHSGAQTGKTHTLAEMTATPEFSDQWTLHVVYGPHGAPDFFTRDDIATFFSAEWKVHYNSSRTGIRLIGPKPEWARRDGGEAGMHPSNIHDNAYAVGSIDFTGDMPVILGPDGPSLGGFVCPATVISADLWKLGQLRAGDHIRFVPVSVEEAVSRLAAKEAFFSQSQAIQPVHQTAAENKDAASPETTALLTKTAIYAEKPADNADDRVIYRLSGDSHLLIEYGEQKLDLRLRFRVHALMNWCERNRCEGMLELTPGIRSLQIHYDPLRLPLSRLMELLQRAESELEKASDIRVPSRIVHLPLSWNDEACQQAVEKYMQSVRKDAPWCPDNIEFIRRINGLADVAEVKKTVFDASYVVMGLGDVYLGAPVATPLDPRHRLVTTKYNPARTWTAENSVGIGGAYLCVYGMEGPGGYQFVGRTLQMWNRYRQTEAFSKPWLLRFFDQIRFYEVSAEELKDIREGFPVGKYPLKIEETEFSLNDYEDFLRQHDSEISHFQQMRQEAFEEELQRWIASGQINFSVEQEPDTEAASLELAETDEIIESPATGSIWKMLVKEGDNVATGSPVAIVESMKMEIEVHATASGMIRKILKTEGQHITGGNPVLVLERTGQTED